MRKRECRFSEKTTAQVLSGHGEWCIPGAVLMHDSCQSRIECELMQDSGSITLVQLMYSFRPLRLSG